MLQFSKEEHWILIVVMKFEATLFVELVYTYLDSFVHYVVSLSAQLQ